MVEITRGLAAGTTPRAYCLPTERLGLRPGVNLDGALRLASAMEDEEAVRELELRK